MPELDPKHTNHFTCGDAMFKAMDSGGPLVPCCCTGHNCFADAPELRELAEKIRDAREKITPVACSAQDCEQPPEWKVLFQERDPDSWLPMCNGHLVALERNVGEISPERKRRM